MEAFPYRNLGTHQRGELDVKENQGILPKDNHRPYQIIRYLAARQLQKRNIGAKSGSHQPFLPKGRAAPPPGQADHLRASCQRTRPPAENSP